MSLTTEKKLYFIGFLPFLVLLSLSWIYWQERTIFIDIAYHLFALLKDQHLAIQNHRFVAVLTQAFPLLGAYIGLSLRATAQLYSVSFVGFYLFCYIVCGLLKQYKAGLVLLFIQLILVTDTFYWIQSELPQGLAVLIVLVALILSKTQQKTVKLIRFALIILTTVTVVFAHPLLLFPLLFCLLFFYVEKDLNIQKEALIFVAAIALASVIIKSVFFKTQYDSESMNHAKNLIERFPNYFRNYANKRFLIDCVKKFHWLAILGIATVLFCWKKKDWKGLLLIAIFFSGYLLLINTSYPDKGTTPFYIENMYLPLAIFIALPFVFLVLPKIKQPVVTTGYLILILTAVIRIQHYHQAYTLRLNWEKDFLANHKHEKLIVDQHLVPMGILQMIWGTPYEFWLLSTIENEQTASLIIAEDANTLEWTTHSNNEWLSTWGTFKYNDLPRRYFKFSDSISNYRIVK